MTDQGCIRTETHDHVFKIIIDNPARKNAFSPQMMMQLSDALTELHEIDGHRVGVVCAEGKDFTAGLDMPKFFGPTAERRTPKQGNVDVFGLGKRCKKPIVTAVQGIVFTIGIELMGSDVMNDPLRPLLVASRRAAALGRRTPRRRNDKHGVHDGNAAGARPPAYLRAIW